MDDDKGNPELKPELKTETEFGMDLRLFDDRLALGFTSYSNVVSDMLINVSKSPSTGYDTQYMNAAEMENTGLELDGSLLLMKGLDLYFNWVCFRIISILVWNLSLPVTVFCGSVV
mgnify:CR=1 FL=1